jgi:hypothetical protein
MNKPIRMSWQTRKNWLIDAAVFGGALASILSGIYFLFFTTGYQGGRNALYGVNLLFSRQTWSDVHTWGGVLMIVAVAAHLAIHWEWIKLMTRRAGRGLRGQATSLSRGAKVNLAVDGVIGVSFALTAVSGVYFLFAPTGGYQGGRNPGWDPGFLFARTTWDLIHTWAAIVMIIAAVLHFAIHWRWIINVTRRFFQSLRQPSFGGKATQEVLFEKR